MRLAPQVPFSVSAVPASLGSAGVAQTMREMRRLIDEGKRDAGIIATAHTVIFTQPEKLEAAEACSLFEFVRDHIRYVRDVVGHETLASARITLARQAGDCDDQTVLLGAMLEAVGYPVRLVVAAYDGPGVWAHVYLQVWAEGRWIDCDPTERQAFGWAPPGAMGLWVES